MKRVTNGLKHELRALAVGGVSLAAVAALSFILAARSAILALWIETILSVIICAVLALRLSAVHREVTTTLNLRLKNLNEELQIQNRHISELSERLQSIFDATDEAIIALHLPQELIAANSAAYRLFGVSPNKSQPLSSFFFRAPELRTLIERCRNEGSAELEQFTVIQDKSESILTARARQFAIGKSKGVVIAISDITSLRKMESVKKNFVANVSHELRTPVQIVKGYAEMLSSADIEEEQRAWAQAIEHQAVRMERIVADLLMLAKLEHDPESWIVRERFSLTAVLQEAAKTVRLRYPASGALEISCPEDLEVDANAGLIEQAVFNLMANAVQHSGSREKITVEATEEQGQVVVRVRDFGAGIAPKDLAHIFERFYRADKSRSSAEVDHASGVPPSGGSGLGLAIVKHIAVAHGGSVRAESWANEGSLFEFRIPRFREGGGGEDHREDAPSRPRA